MKRILVILFVVVVLGGIAYLKSLDAGVIYAENPEPEVVEEVPAWMTDQEAVEAAQAVIRRKELEAEKKRLGAEISALAASLVEIEAQLDEY